MFTNLHTSYRSIALQGTIAAPVCTIDRGMNASFNEPVQKPLGDLI
jgi:hypothetical protein